VNPFPTGIAALSDIIEIKRESLRGTLALIVVGLLVVYSLGMLVYVILTDSANADMLISGVFTPIIGIVGTVLGFYFGSQEKK
jgi:hypothetical protein